MIQANEPGPFEQSIAGLDIAAWDLAARRAGVPLYTALNPEGSSEVPVYASALTAETLDQLVPPLLDQGWGGFKVKVGFGNEQDLQAVKRLRELIGAKALMLDANQSWETETAVDQIAIFSDYAPYWIEEPIAADAGDKAWAMLAQKGPSPLAAGENLRGVDRFEDILNAGVRYVQPDPIKWGGLSALIEIADMTQRESCDFAPHYLGGGVGLLATCHAALAFGASWMEMDVTENPFRDDLVRGVNLVTDGHLHLANEPGIHLPALQQLI